MYLCSSEIAGVKELSGIGYPSHYDTGPTMKNAYKSNMNGIGVNCSVVIASVIKKQFAAIKLLTSNGFIQVGRAKKNPNSGNSILLFVKFIDKQKSKETLTQQLVRVDSIGSGMRIGNSQVSCGINELIINSGHLTQKRLNNLIFNSGSICAMIITNVSTRRKKLIKLLEKNNFKRVGQASTLAARTEYVFLVRRLNRIEIALTKRNWKKKYGRLIN